MGKKMNTNKSNKELLSDLGANVGSDSDGELEENNTQSIESSAADNKTEYTAKLAKRINEMSHDERVMMSKIVQHDAIQDMLKALSNLKNTTPGTWQNVIGELKFARALSIKDRDSNFDPVAFFNKILPLIGAIAGALIAARAAEIEDIETATPPDEELEKSKETARNEFNKMKRKSIILTMCDEKTNGYSL